MYPTTIAGIVVALLLIAMTFYNDRHQWKERFKDYKDKKRKP